MVGYDVVLYESFAESTTGVNRGFVVFGCIASIELEVLCRLLPKAISIVVSSYLKIYPEWTPA